MTTLIALASSQAVVMGTDSLGTELRTMIDPNPFAEKYFDSADGYKLKLDDQGKPLLDDALKLVIGAQRVPYNQQQHVNKLFRLGGASIGCAITGTVAVGSRMVRSLISEFVEGDAALNSANYKVRGVSERLLAFLKAQFDSVYGEDLEKPDLELIVAGYDSGDETPSIFRVIVKDDALHPGFSGDDPYGVVFGGQTDWIERIVFGTDYMNRLRLRARSEQLMQLYRQKIGEELQLKGVAFDVPEPASFGEELDLFHDWGLNTLESDWVSYSEQNAIDCVNFFLRIMIDAQNISSQLPTVGPPVHIVVIRPDGYYPVTKETWTVGGHEVEIPEVGR